MKKNGLKQFAGINVFPAPSLAALFLLLCLSGWYGCSNDKKEVPEQKVTKKKKVSEEGERLLKMSSSVNEESLLQVLQSLASSQQYGSTRTIKTGETPFRKIGRLPLDKGDHLITIKNETGEDAVFLQFSTDYPFAGEEPKVCAVFIAAGDSLSFRSTNNFGRIHFILGKRWAKLNETLSLQMKRVRSGGKQSMAGGAEIDAFFKRSLPDQSLLQRSVLLHHDYQESYDQKVPGVPQPTIINKPASSLQLSEGSQTTLRLTMKDGAVQLKATGGLHVYLSAPIAYLEPPRIVELDPEPSSD